MKGFSGPQGKKMLSNAFAKLSWNLPLSKNMLLNGETVSLVASSQLRGLKMKNFSSVNSSGFSIFILSSKWLLA